MELDLPPLIRQVASSLLDEWKKCGIRITGGEERKEVRHPARRSRGDITARS